MFCGTNYPPLADKKQDKQTDGWRDNKCDRIWEKGSLRAKRYFLPLFKLSSRQGLQSPWLPASFRHFRPSTSQIQC